MKFENAYLHNLREKDTEARPQSFGDRSVTPEPSVGGGINVDAVSCKASRLQCYKYLLSKNHALRCMCNSKEGVDLVIG